MARAEFIKCARKDYPNFGIKKGDSYYKWSFRFGGTHMSKTAPKRSQLTQSDFLGQIYDLEDDVLSCPDVTSVSDLESVRDDAVSTLEDLKSECEDKLSNMPDHLQESSPAGQTLQNRIDSLDEMIQELEGLDFDVDEDYSERAHTIHKNEDGTETKEYTESLEDYKERLQSVIEDCDLDNLKEDSEEWWEQVEEKREEKEREQLEEKQEELSNISYNGE